MLPASRRFPESRAEILANRITEAGGQAALYVSSFAEAADGHQRSKPGDMILTLGAGSISH